MEYGYSKTVDLSYEKALERIEEELKERGFGVLTEIDVRATMKKKLDLEMNDYKILGACNPPFAHQALEQEQEIGLLLPCNVIVYVNDEGKTIISAVNAEVMLSIVGDDPELQQIASEVSSRLRDAVDAVVTAESVGA
ncbi:MAG TPA: DUF302 domain-containing protein [bacterium]|nr:DUF302 domain-containing protein [bacterium]